VSDHDIYLEAVNNVRLLVHTLEAAILSLYDDSSTFLLMVQFMYLSQSHQKEDAACNYFDAITICMKVNLDVVQQSFRALLAVGHDQAALSLWQGHPFVWRQLLIIVNYTVEDVLVTAVGTILKLIKTSSIVFNKNSPY